MDHEIGKMGIDPVAAGSDQAAPATEARTLLFTDIEGSTRLLQTLGEGYAAVLEAHLDILNAAVTAGGGEVFGSAGDAIFAAFSRPAAAVGAAVAAQRALADEAWPGGTDLKVRMGVHAGEVTRTASTYVGLDLHRAARISAVAWGGQIVVSQTTRDLVAGSLPSDCELRDLGAHRLKDLAVPEHIFQVVGPGLQAEFPPLRSLDALPNNLPTQLTSFVGRDRELAEALALLDGTRLLTLTGPGGTGKTRLSLQLAAEVADLFPDGAWFVALEPIFQADLVASTILAALGLPETGGRPPLERLIEYLSAKRLLLVLDNFEQVIEAAPVVAELLRGAPDVKVVVTSRAALRVSGEQEYPVPPLPVPDPDALPTLDQLGAFESVSLFVQRARSVQPAFRLDPGNAAAVATIASSLDGLPLALELAAARVKILPPDAIAARLGNRLGLLASGSRDLPTRQQTLRDAIGWSYDLLDTAARRLLERLSVFVGGATLEHAEAVCGPADDLGADVLDGLGFLVDQSLLRQLEWEGEPRFSMFETIREFAVEKLAEGGEAATIRRRHAERFLALVEEAEPHLTGRDQLQWLDRLEADHDNLRSALAWMLEESETELALRYLGAVWRFWQIRGYIYEGRMRAEAVLELPDVEDHPPLLGKAYEAAGGISYWQGDNDTTLRWYGASLDQYRAVGDRSDIARATYNLAFGHAFAHQTDTARELLRKALAVYEELGDKQGRANVLWGLSDVQYWDGNVDSAYEAVTECIPLYRELEDPFGLGWALHMRGIYELQLDRPDEAAASFSEGLQIFVRSNDVSAMTLLLDDFAWLAERRGEMERAVRLLGAADRAREVSGTDLVQKAVEMHRREEIATDLDPEVRERLLAEGHRLSIEEAVALALE